VVDRAAQVVARVALDLDAGDPVARGIPGAEAPRIARQERRDARRPDGRRDVRDPRVVGHEQGGVPHEGRGAPERRAPAQVAHRRPGQRPQPVRERALGRDAREPHGQPARGQAVGHRGQALERPAPARGRGARMQEGVAPGLEPFLGEQARVRPLLLGGDRQLEVAALRGRAEVGHEVQVAVDLVQVLGIRDGGLEILRRPAPGHEEAAGAAGAEAAVTSLAAAFAP
jgi:hypothetical protein